MSPGRDESAAGRIVAGSSRRTESPQEPPACGESLPPAAALGPFRRRSDVEGDLKRRDVRGSEGPRERASTNPSPETGLGERPPRRSGLTAMFEQATATVDSRHRGFFDAGRGPAGVGAASRRDPVLSRRRRRRRGGAGGRARGSADLPVSGLPRSAVHRQGRQRAPPPLRAQVAGQEHRSTAAWRHQALLMLADWTARRYPHLEAELDDREEGESLQLRSPRTGRVGAADGHLRPPLPAAGTGARASSCWSALARAAAARREADGAPARWWCGEGRLVGDSSPTTDGRWRSTPRSDSSPPSPTPPRPRGRA